MTTDKRRLLSAHSIEVLRLEDLKRRLLEGTALGPLAVPTVRTEPLPEFGPLEPSVFRPGRPGTQLYQRREVPKRSLRELLEVREGSPALGAARFAARILSPLEKATRAYDEWAIENELPTSDALFFANPGLRMIGSLEQAAAVAQLKQAGRAMAAGAKAGGRAAVPAARKLATEERGFVRLPGAAGQAEAAGAAAKEPWVGTVIESTTKPSAKQLQRLLPNHVRQADFEVRRLPKEQYAMPSWEVRWKATEMEPGWAVVAREGSVSIESAVPAWQMKQDAYVRLYYPKAEGKGAFPDLEKQHSSAVQQALSEGKPVPLEVLKDYPDLVKPVVPEAVAPAGAPPTQPPKVPPVEPPVPPTAAGAVPPKEPNELVQAVAKAIRGAKKPLAAKEAEVSKELGRRAAEAQAKLRAGDRIGARAAFMGELPDAPDFVPISGGFSAADGNTLRQMIVKKYGTGDIGDSFRFMQTDTAFTKLWDKGQIPTRSELVALEEVFGKPFVEAVLSLRSMPSKAWELFLELWNIPRTMLATGDISATMRQGGLFIFTDKAGPWRTGFKEQLKAFNNKAHAIASMQRIAEHPLYEASQRAGLDLTVAGTIRRAAAVTAREEPFIGSRLLSKIPVYGQYVQASERAYVTMLNEVRFGTFVQEATKLGEAVTTKQLRDLASTINILSGRASLGKLTEASTILNGIFFAPRFALSRFLAPAQVVVGSAPSRKLAAKLLVSYATTVTGMLALADISGVARVEWNPLSSDFGKMRFGNLRIDPWMGLQQPVVLASRLAMGKTKRLDTGEIRKLDAKQAVIQFLTNKLQPTSRFLIQRGEGFAGAKPFEPSPIPGVPNVVFDNFVPIFMQDMAEAYRQVGPLGLAVGPLTILGVGTQAFGETTKGRRLPTRRLPARTPTNRRLPPRTLPTPVGMTP